MPGVQAIVLGGSYARGAQHAGSDLDIGLYYREAQPFDVQAIRTIADSLSPDPVVTGFYEWGPWVNGGAWIHTPSGKVDFIYRSIDQVERTVEEARQGIIYHDFDQQPAYGFYSVIYLGETRVCLPLYDPAGLLGALKERVAVYPPRLKEKIVGSSLWLAEFSLAHARGCAAAGDVYATAGALTRTAAYLAQCLFALNETYFLNDKTAMKEIAAFPVRPERYGERLSAVLARPGDTPAELLDSTHALQGLWQAVVELTGGTYRPAFPGFRR